MAVDFKEKQREFAAYIRDPENNPVPPDVDRRRMSMYRELFFNNIESFLSGNFPVLRAITDDTRWLALAQDFFIEHRCKTPYFSEIAEEFLDYVQNERKKTGDFPFMLELAHYEWVEMALANSKEQLVINEPDITNLLKKSVSLSPLAWPLIYQYPVHKIAPSFLPQSPPAEPTCLIVYRNRDDDVGFIEITPSTYKLLLLVEECGSLRVEDCQERMVQEFLNAEPDIIRQGALQVLIGLAEKNIVTIAD